MGVFKMSKGPTKLSTGPILGIASQRNEDYTGIYGSRDNQNPDPSNFKILKRKNKGDFSLLEVKYPNCTNFKGTKILLLKRNGQVIEKLKQLDPHFLEEQGNVEILGRFRPTKEGWNMGLQMLEFISK
jgi:hypothetical protein